MGAEIKCTSLQSLMKILVYSFYFVLFAVHYCALHLQDVLSDTTFDARERDGVAVHSSHEYFMACRWFVFILLLNIHFFLPHIF
jgi:hypothetical protein